MRYLFLPALLLTVAGCAAQPSRPQTAAQHAPAAPPAPPFYVPATALARTADSRPINPFAVLADADEDLFFPRPEKVVYGPETLYQTSAFTIFDYDAQNISSPYGTGFRYRWVVRQGVQFP
ncbi:MAG TPA: hypothetical protein VHQ47_12865 [Phycisphaerae bacterium]|nr:hypothetical protein [Phycisphaerae bacterium]